MSTKIKDAKGYYKQLEIHHHATGDEIKQSYRKLALKWHPDKNPDNVTEATVVFQKISEAYSVLSDPGKREKYDKYGDIEDFDFDYNDFINHFDFSAIFSSVLGGFEFMNHVTKTLNSKHGSKRKVPKPKMRGAHHIPTHMFNPFNFNPFGNSTKPHAHKHKEGSKPHEEGWETTSEYSDDDEEEETTAKTSNKDVKKEETKHVEKEEDWEDDEGDDFDDEDDDGMMDEMEAEEDRKLAKEMYGSEDEEDLKTFDNFMNEAQNMFIIPLFAEENSIPEGKKTKCKLCKKVLNDSAVIGHFSKEHKKELEAFIEKTVNEDYEDDMKRYKGKSGGAKSKKAKI